MRRSLKSLLLGAFFVCVFLVCAEGTTTNGSSAAEAQANKRNKPATGCSVHAVKTTSASGSVEMKLICDGECMGDKPCAERWLYTYDWKDHKKVLTRTCYCTEEIREPPCCTDEDSKIGVSYIKGKCRVALLYPPGADVGADGQQSKDPTKDPISVICVGDRPVMASCNCRIRSRTITEDGVRVELMSCKCFY